ncbi:GNAT family N-acetyltransferase [Streptomyces sp. NPDC091279]|uniref:GNAT family N-acetyltransferase n=1 Tax=unclassified Streptomyces TaxID=2593676 RepID=UPI00381ACF66
MTTTLRPTEPLQHAADGTRSRHYQVCVNSRPVGTLHLGTSPALGDSVARVLDLRVDERDRRRGRGTVAALAAEEVARGWGCRVIEIAVPADAGAALRLVEALGYLPRNRGMHKHLPDTPPVLPEGSRGRPMTDAEWRAHFGPEHWEAYTRSWTGRGVPEAAARAKVRRDREAAPGFGAKNVRFSVLEHQGTRVGTLYLGLREQEAFVYDVQVDPAHRGHGHGRTLMLLAERQAIEAAHRTLALNVFAGNTPAERLYTSLGYEHTVCVLQKPLL